MKKCVVAGMGFVGAALLMVAMSGCQESNEKAANIISTPPKAGESVPNSQEEHFKRQQELQKKAYGGGYPGAKR